MNCPRCGYPDATCGCTASELKRSLTSALSSRRHAETRLATRTQERDALQTENARLQQIEEDPSGEVLALQCEVAALARALNNIAAHCVATMPMPLDVRAFITGARRQLEEEGKLPCPTPS